MRKLFASLLLMGALLLLTGCQLASDRGESSQDQLVGVFITTEYLDLMDVQAYVSDHQNDWENRPRTVAGDTSAYQGRLYAEDVSKDPQRPDYRFPGIEGVPVYCVPLPEPDESDVYCWTPSEAPEAWTHYGYTVEDGGESMVLTSELCVAAQDGEQNFYANPIYRTEAGEIYLMSGSGVGQSGRSTEKVGSALTLTAAETVEVALRGEATRYRCEVKATVTFADPVEKDVLIQMDGNDQVLGREEFLPGQAPAEFAPARDTAYLILETHRQSKSGEQTVERSLYDRADEVFTTYQVGESNFFCRTDTEIHWK